MKVAVISDTHLGYSYGTKRGLDAFRNMGEALEKALKEQPDLILFPGDVFHDKVPKPEVLAGAVELLKQLNKKLRSKAFIIKRVKDNQEQTCMEQIPPIVTIYGTHERRGLENVNPIQLLEKAGLIYNLHEESILLKVDSTQATGTLGIHGLSGVPDKYAKESMIKWSPRAFPGVKNILMIHQTFKDLIPATPENVLEYKDLPVGFDLMLLGHIHWNQEDKHPVDGNCKIIVPGSTVRTQLNKREDKKGFYILDIGKSVTLAKFVELDGVRNFFYNEIDVTNKKPSEVEDLLDNTIQELIKQNSKELEPLIKIKLIGQLAEGFAPADLQLSTLNKKYKDNTILKLDKTSVTVSESSLEETKKILADFDTKKLSVEDMGLNLLANNLQIRSITDLENLFNLLAEGNTDSIMHVINDMSKFETKTEVEQPKPKNEERPPLSGDLSGFVQ